MEYLVTMNWLNKASTPLKFLFGVTIFFNKGDSEYDPDPQNIFEKIKNQYMWDYLTSSESIQGFKYLELWQLARSVIQHEDNLISQRINWFVQVNGFLIAGIVSLFAFVTKNVQFHVVLAIIIFLSFVGATVSLLTKQSVEGAITHIMVMRIWLEQLTMQEPPPTVGIMPEQGYYSSSYEAFLNKEEQYRIKYDFPPKYPKDLPSIGLIFWRLLFWVSIIALLLSMKLPVEGFFLKQDPSQTPPPRFYFLKSQAPILDLFGVVGKIQQA